MIATPHACALHATAPVRTHAPWCMLALVAILTLPWLWPMTWGPLTNAVPWMVSATCAMLALALAPSLQRGRLPEVLAWSLVLGADANAVAALIQWLGLAPDWAPWVAQSPNRTAYGNLRQPNQLASLLALGIWAAVFLVGHAAGHGRVRRWLMPWCVLSVAMQTGALVLSGSRTGVAHMVCLLLMGLLWWRADRDVSQRQADPKQRWLIGAALVLYLAFMAALPWLTELLDSQSSRGTLIDRLENGNSACGSRLTLWRNVLHLIALKPWMGWGWGNLDWAHYMTLYEGPRFCHILDNAHNLPLHLAVELGVPVALLVCGVIAGLTVWQRPWLEPTPSRRLAWAVLLVLGVHSLVEYPLWYGPFQLSAICALLILAWPSPDDDNDRIWLGQPASRLPQFGRAWCLPLACTGMLVLSYVAHDYWRISQLFLAPAERASRYQDDTLNKVRDSWLFRGTVDFAALSITPVTHANACELVGLAQRNLHYSPEPRVIEKLITSAAWCGREDITRSQIPRYRAAYPNDYAKWAADWLMPPRPGSARLP